MQTHGLNADDQAFKADDENITDDILEKLENQILPIYYDKDSKYRPNKWIEMMKNARSLVYNDFSMTRALKDYLVEGMEIHP